MQIFSEFAERRCTIEGIWETKPGNLNGWTNYTPCYTPELFELIKKLYKTDEAQVLLNLHN